MNINHIFEPEPPFIIMECFVHNSKINEWVVSSRGTINKLDNLYGHFNLKAVIPRILLCFVNLFGFCNANFREPQLLTVAAAATRSEEPKARESVKDHEDRYYYSLARLLCAVLTLRVYF
jgi:hypothetical protein